MIDSQKLIISSLADLPEILFLKMMSACMELGTKWYTFKL